MPRDMNIRLMNIAERNTTYQKALLSVPACLCHRYDPDGLEKASCDKEEKSAHGYVSLWKWS
ncbi:hypothetical protein [Methanomethylophilus alvi]|uniref:hypothetical protein n=1 Tax=Methanomethylophilus alvi TaxID=1291540 RepID=UPI0037DC8185